MSRPKITLLLCSVLTAIIGTLTVSTTPAEAIINGRKATSGLGRAQIWESPTTDPNAQKNLICTGILVTSHDVVTAKHCLEKPAAYYSIRAGSTVRGEGHLSQVDSIVFAEKTDIAVMRLKTPAPDTMVEYELPDPGTEPDRSWAEIAGWGRIGNSPVRQPDWLQIGEFDYVGPNKDVPQIHHLRFKNGIETAPGDSGAPVYFGDKLQGMHISGNASIGLSAFVNLGEENVSNFIRRNIIPSGDHRRVRIMNATVGTCVTAYDRPTRPVVLERCDGDNLNGNWKMIPYPWGGKHFQLQNYATGECLDAESQPGQRVYASKCDNADSGQYWLYGGCDRADGGTLMAAGPTSHLTRWNDGTVGMSNDLEPGKQNWSISPKPYVCD